MLELDYVMDVLGNRTEKMATLSRGSLFESVTQETYEYDALGQLVQVEESLRGSAVSRTAYTYDPVGNRASLEEFDFIPSQGWTPSRMVQYAYDEADQLLTAGATSYTYDGNGNRVTKSESPWRTTHYVYDTSGRLVEVDRGWRRVSYSYDGDGNKVARSEARGSKIETKMIVNDVATAIPVVLQEREGTATTSYALGLGLISREVDSSGNLGSSFYHSDGLGSTLALTNTEGRAAARYEYDPWGSVEKGLRRSTNEFLFAGEELDSETGLYYLRSRWYDAQTGSFVSRDPLLGLASRPLSSNRYLYVQNNPANLVDPLGLEPQTTGGGVRLAANLTNAYGVLREPDNSTLLRDYIGGVLKDAILDRVRFGDLIGVTFTLLDLLERYRPVIEHERADIDTNLPILAENVCKQEIDVPIEGIFIGSVTNYGRYFNRQNLEGKARAIAQSQGRCPTQ